MSGFGFGLFLLLVAAALLVAEVFVPSGGLISIVALGCLVWAVASGFGQSSAAGWGVIGLGGILIPVTWVAALRWLPKSRWGRGLTLEPPTESDGDAGTAVAVSRGDRGTTVTPLHPLGICEFAGRKLECTVESGYVDAHQVVEVIDVQGRRITVRPVRTQDPEEGA